jgi:hypothetical protein
VGFGSSSVEAPNLRRRVALVPKERPQPRKSLGHRRNSASTKQQGAEGCARTTAPMEELGIGSLLKVGANLEQPSDWSCGSTLSLQGELLPKLCSDLVGKLLRVSHALGRRNHSRAPAQHCIRPHRYENAADNQPLKDHVLQFDVSLCFFLHGFRSVAPPLACPIVT